MHDLLQAAGYAALVYLLFNYVVTFGSGRPLVEAVNPNRRFLPLFAVGLFGAAYTLLLRGAWRTNSSQLALLHQLVTEEKAPAEAVGAVSFVVFGLSVLLLWGWCWWNLPRDPKTFNANPKDPPAEYARAIAHFVRWDGGLDFAVLGEVRGGVHAVVCEGWSHRDIARGLARLPTVGTAAFALDPAKAVDEQKGRWRTEARRLFDALPTLDELLAAVKQGPNVTVSFDARHGAVYFEVLERPDHPDGVGLYLFAATLNQHEVNTLTTARHFYALAQAVRHVRTGVTKR